MHQLRVQLYFDSLRPILVATSGQSDMFFLVLIAHFAAWRTSGFVLLSASNWYYQKLVPAEVQCHDERL